MSLRHMRTDRVTSCCVRCRVRESVDITRLSQIVKSNLHAGQENARAASGDVSLASADAEVDFIPTEEGGCFSTMPPLSMQTYIHLMSTISLEVLSALRSMVG